MGSFRPIVVQNYAGLYLRIRAKNFLWNFSAW